MVPSVVVMKLADEQTSISPYAMRAPSSKGLLSHDCVEALGLWRNCSVASINVLSGKDGVEVVP